MPESPVWLVAQNRMDEAKSSILRLRGPRYDAEYELSLLDLSQQLQGKKVGVTELARHKMGLLIALGKLAPSASPSPKIYLHFDKYISQLRRPGAISHIVYFFSKIYPEIIWIFFTGLMIFQQLSGVNTVIFYAEIMFIAAGSKLSSTTCSVIVGVVQVIATYVSTLLVDRTGRKLLLLISSSVMALCLLSLATYFHLLVPKLPIVKLNYHFTPMFRQWKLKIGEIKKKKKKN